jgi:hypothetical protein
LKSAIRNPKSAIEKGGTTMGAMVNPFTGTGYDIVALTAAINKLPNLYGRLEELGLFPVDGVTTTSVTVEQLNGTLNIVRSRPRGAAADKAIADKRGLRVFAVPHIPLDDVIQPEEIQDVRAFGSASALETQGNVIARKLQKCKNMLDQTLEYLRMGALKGIILDADVSTIYNLYTEFGISAKTVYFDLADEDTEVIEKCLEVTRHIESHLFGERMTGIRSLVSPEFFDALTTHVKVQEAFKYFQNMQQVPGKDYRKGFLYGGIVWEEYSAVWTDKDANSRKAITAELGHAFPEGTGETFKTVVAPGNFMETVNTVGQLYYAKQEPRKFNQGLDIHTEMNALPICLRPEVLVKVSTAASA